MSEVPAVQPTGALATIPDFMKEDAGKGTEESAKFITPPRLKIVQPLSTLKEEFNEGDVLAMPQKIMLSPINLTDKGKPDKEGRPFLFTPIFFWPEWATWNPVGSETMIADRTIDPRSELAQKARDFNRRTEITPEGVEQKHCESLNFVIMLHNHEMSALPLIVSFVRSEHKSGSSLNALIHLRKPAPIFGCVYQAITGLRSNPQGNWFGLNISNPPEGSSPIVTHETQYKEFRELHESMKALHGSGDLEIPLEEDAKVD